jgi:predicted nucleotidyltransferase
MRIEKDFKEFIALLNENKVKYLIVGGFAFAFYVEPRYTKDIDIFVEASEENSKKIIDALTAFGFGNIGLKEEDFQKPDQIIQLGYAPVRIDIITSIAGVTFDSAWKNKVEGKYGDIPCFFISKEDLILNKQKAARPQDITDVNKLKKI